MTKQLNWDAIANVNFDEKRRKAHGMTTGKELMAKAVANTLRAEEALVRRREVEPILKKALIDAIVSRTPIRVRCAIQNPTENINGINKSDDDGFYNTSPSMQAEAMAKARFEEVMETIPTNTELIFKAWDKQLGQWIFKGSNGNEYAIYSQCAIIYKGEQMENPGLYGLLFNTSLIDSLGE